MTDEPLREVKFKNHQQRADREPPPGYENLGGEFVSPQYKAFLLAAMEGKLPQPDVPQLPAEVIALAEELMTIHLPEWKNPAGRKLAGPTSMQIGGSVRVAEYFLQRGISFDPEKATIRWVSTPGARLGSGDPGKHIYRRDDGTWPEDPDIEEFWRVEDIECHQLPDGKWAAVHPRGIQCEDASKTEAYSMCVQRVAAKVSELKGQR